MPRTKTLTLQRSAAAALSLAALFGAALSGPATASAQVPGGPGAITLPSSPPDPPTRPGGLADPGGGGGDRPTGPGVIVNPENPNPDPDPPGPYGPQAPTGLLSEPPMDLDAMVDELESRVHAGPSTGWAYSVMREGTVVASNSGGFARRPFDGNFSPFGTKFKTSTRIEIMSATKPITAMATLRALDHAGISVDSPVGAYLPSGWSKGPGFSAGTATPVTFRHLLTHTSGILQAFQDDDIDHTGWGNAWAGLEPIVGQGVTPDVAAGTKYKNANYALLRVILPKLWALAGGPASAVTEGNHGLRFLSYVNDYVLAPAGVKPTKCWETNDLKAARVYNKTDLGIGGALIEYDADQHGECGGHRGLHLSTDDLVRITHTLRSTTKILSPAMKTAMFAGKLGWDKSSDKAGSDKAGLWWHGGDGFFGGGRDVHTCVMNAPQNYQLAIIFNSQTPTSTYQCTILKVAVNAAR